MKIMIFDVPAVSGGALSILQYFYDEAKEDNANDYTFIVSKPKLEKTKNIKIMRYPWVKKSWIHRIYFDNIIAPKLIRENLIDKVISLQNIIIPHSKVYQTVYIHNSLPFSEYRFSIYKNTMLWFYQNIIGKMVFNSIKKSNRVIVQTKWMKEACIKKVNINSSKIDIITPNKLIKVQNYFESTKDSLTTYFYPASGVEFKNHKVIIEACLLLKEKDISNFRILFTLEGNENINISKLHNEVIKQKLPIKFIGNISREKVFDYYLKSVLIFPSYIESLGLPLIEAKLHKTPIISSDCNFSREILKNYSGAVFFKPFDSQKLSILIENKIIISKKGNF